LPDGTTQIRSDFKTVIQDLRLFVPTAFTPNGDGLNDNFAPKGLFWNKYELTIYNRWGQTVFVSTTKQKVWDSGQFNPDLYHYVIHVEDQYENAIDKKGTFQLIR
jgi:gliding motility-associated-like protein